jgi:hypothetical protein
MINNHYDEKKVAAMLNHIDGSISQTDPIRYKGNHEKMRNLPAELRKQLIETICPPEGYDQAMIAGKHVPYSLLSQKILSRRRRYDTEGYQRRKMINV